MGIERMRENAWVWSFFAMGASVAFGGCSSVDTHKANSTEVVQAAVVASASAAATPSPSASAATPSPAGAQLQRLEIPSAVMAGGETAVVADFNGDHLSDVALLPTLGRSAGRIALQRQDASGLDVIEGAIPEQLVVKSATAADFDGDGDVDLLIIDAKDPVGPKLYLNQWAQKKTVSFVLASAAAGVPYLPFSSAVVAFDFDGDGDQDVAILSYPGAPQGAGVQYSSVILENRLIPDKAFRFVTKAGGIKPNPSFTGTNILDAKVIDANGDGRPDLFATRDGDDLLLIQQADRTFADESAARGLNIYGSRKGLGVADLDGDGDLDVAEVDAFGQVTLLLNDSKGKFSSKVVSSSVGSASGLVVQDVTADGHADLIVTSANASIPNAVLKFTGVVAGIPQFAATSAVTFPLPAAVGRAASEKTGGQIAIALPSSGSGKSELYVRRLIQSITLSKPVICEGESVRLTVQAQDAASPGVTPTVYIDGSPVSDMYEQFSSAGTRLFPVSVRGSDGLFETVQKSVTVKQCPGATQVRPTLIASPSYFHPDSVDLAVLNATRFDDGGQSYHWDFGDGTVLDTPLAAVSHDYSGVLNNSKEYQPFNVTVTVKHPSVPDSSATRTLVIWNTYAISKRRGVLEPPSEPVSTVFRREGTDLADDISVSNRESTVLTITQRRIDEVPCVDGSVTQHALESTTFTVPAKGTTTQTLRVPAASIGSKTCALNVHFWGSTAAGDHAQFSVQVDLPSQLGSGARVTPQMQAMLKYLTAKGLTANPYLVTEEEIGRLFRERKIRFSDATQTFYGNAPQPNSKGFCDPLSPGAAPEPGYSCQPTGNWSVDTPGFPAEGQVANAMKGDTILERSCSGYINSLVGALDPPQLYTHTGIMTQNRVEIAQSTGDDGYLSAKHANGVKGLPTDGFDEDALRYLWPGMVTMSVQQAFVDGKPVLTPEGDVRNVGGFSYREEQCANDRSIVFPRVLKPAPELDAQIRPKLNAAADAAKGIHGHYRFFMYSTAQDTPTPDPKAPAPILDSSGQAVAYGQVPGECALLVHYALRAGGFTEMDHDKTFPMVSDVRNGAKDGLFYYDPTERAAAAQVLHDGIYNKVRQEVETTESNVDNYWWIGPVAGGAIAGPPGIVVGAVLGGLESETGSLFNDFTDIESDVPNQITNCFASDFCSTDAKDSENWKNPGSGSSVSPDDLMNYYDSPKTGGPYGYHERLVYRGKRFQAEFEWTPSPGTRTLDGKVVLADGSAVAGATVEVLGSGKPAVASSAAGLFSFAAVPGSNVSVHAQKLISDKGTDSLWEGTACYNSPDANHPEQLRLVDCHDFSKFLDAVVYSQVTVQLKPPADVFRHVVVQGTADLDNCNCIESDTFTHPNFLVTCDVDATTKPDGTPAGTPTETQSSPQLCDDEIGAVLSVTCTIDPDGRSVHVTGHAILREAGSGSCGGDDPPDTSDFDAHVAPGANVTPYFPETVHEDTCYYGPFPSGCNDRVGWTVTISNQTAP